MDPGGGYLEYAFVAELYDHVMPYRERPDVGFYVDLAVASGGPVLEMACGTGRILVPTARAGVAIEGLDLSEHMLSVCRERLAREPVDVGRRAVLHRGDMRGFDLGRTFPLVTVPFNAFQHLVQVEDQLACLSCVRRHLAPGGTFVLDVFNPSLERLVDPSTEAREPEPPFTMPDGRVVTRRARQAERRLALQVLDCELIYDVRHPDGRVERLVHAFAMRYFFRFEVEHLLARSGLRIAALYGDHARGPFTSVSKQIVVMARE